MPWTNPSEDLIDAKSNIFYHDNDPIVAPSPSETGPDHKSPLRASSLSFQPHEQYTAMEQPAFTSDAPGKVPLPSLPAGNRTTTARPSEPSTATQALLEQMEAPDLQSALRRWTEVSKSLDQERMQVQKLSADSTRQKQQIQDLKRHIISLEGFAPAFDEDIQADFVRLNQKIRSLAGQLKQTMTHPDRYLRGFLTDTSLFWYQGIHPHWSGRSISDIGLPSKVKLLLIHIIWRFLEKALFDRRSPFSAFSPSINFDHDQLANQLNSIYDDMRVTESTVRAAWRVSSMQELTEREKSYSTEADVCSRLERELIQRLSKLPDDSLRKNLYSTSDPDSVLGNQLRVTFQAAIRLAKKLNSQKAEYSLEVPDTTGHASYVKEEEDEQTTNDGISVGIDGLDAEEAPGPVNFVVTPMLVKWGDARGQRLDKHQCLVKALVDIDTASEDIETTGATAESKHLRNEKTGSSLRQSTVVLR